MARLRGRDARGGVLTRHGPILYRFGVGYPSLLQAVVVVRRHDGWVTRVGGVLLIVVGLAVVTGLWTEFVDWLSAAVGAGEIGI